MKANHAGQVNARRIKVRNALQAQLERGTKPEKGLHPLTSATTGGNEIPLTEGDVKRIKKELSVLDSRIVSPEVARSTRTKKSK